MFCRACVLTRLADVYISMTVWGCCQCRGTSGYRFAQREITSESFLDLSVPFSRLVSLSASQGNYSRKGNRRLLESVVQLTAAKDSEVVRAMCSTGGFGLLVLAF